MKVLVLGATGYIGSAVAERLRAEGHQVLGLARSAEAEQRVKAAGHQPVRGDVADPARVAELARGADAVIHAANTGTADNPRVDLAMTRAVIAALEGSGAPFVYTSGVWSLGDTGEGIADERASNLHALPLSAWRTEAEREVVGAAARGVRSVLLRPGIVYGRAGGIPASLVAEAKAKGGVRVIGDGRQEWPSVHVDDLARLYALALTAPAGSVLHGTDGQHRARDVAVAASVAGGANGRILPWTVEDARREYGGYGEFFALHQRVSSDVTRRVTGWAPREPSLVEELLLGSYATPPR